MPKYIITIGSKPFLMENDEMTPLETDKVYEVVEKRLDKRTVQQNRALHLYCKQVAEALNNAGLTVTMVLKPEIQFSMVTVKEQMFKPILTALRGKESTTQMTSKEINDVYDVMNKALSQKFGIHVEFPSIESMMFKEQLKDK